MGRRFYKVTDSNNPYESPSGEVRDAVGRTRPRKLTAMFIVTAGIVSSPLLPAATEFLRVTRFAWEPMDYILLSIGFAISSWLALRFVIAIVGLSCACFLLAVIGAVGASQELRPWNWHGAMLTYISFAYGSASIVLAKEAVSRLHARKGAGAEIRG